MVFFKSEKLELGPAEVLKNEFFIISTFFPFSPTNKPRRSSGVVCPLG